MPRREKADWSTPRRLRRLPIWFAGGFRLPLGGTSSSDSFSAVLELARAIVPSDRGICPAFSYPNRPGPPETTIRRRKLFDGAAPVRQRLDVPRDLVPTGTGPAGRALVRLVYDSKQVLRGEPDWVAGDGWRTLRLNM